jgi:hypothetical protein
VRTTLIGAGVLGALVTFAPLLIPSVRRADDGSEGAPARLAEAVAARAGG